MITILFHTWCKQFIFNPGEGHILAVYCGTGGWGRKKKREFISSRSSQLWFLDYFFYMLLPYISSGFKYFFAVFVIVVDTL